MNTHLATAVAAAEAAESAFWIASSPETNADTAPSSMMAAACRLASSALSTPFATCTAPAPAGV